MRELKFRYICKDMLGRTFTFVKTIEEMERAELNINTYGRIQEIVSRDQYTGLKDKNGKEIYEGDIIEFQYDTGYSKEITKGIIEFGEYYAGQNDWGNIKTVGFYVQQIDVCIRQEWNMCDNQIREGKIIGNIYKNPELAEAINQ